MDLALSYILLVQYQKKLKSLGSVGLNVRPWAGACGNFKHIDYSHVQHTKG